MLQKDYGKENIITTEEKQNKVVVMDSKYWDANHQ